MPVEVSKMARKDARADGEPGIWGRASTKRSVYAATILGLFTLGGGALGAFGEDLKCLITGDPTTSELIQAAIADQQTLISETGSLQKGYGELLATVRSVIRLIEKQEFAEKGYTKKELENLRRKVEELQKSSDADHLFRIMYDIKYGYSDRELPEQAKKLRGTELPSTSTIARLRTLANAVTTDPEKLEWSQDELEIAGIALGVGVRSGDLVFLSDILGKCGSSEMKCRSGASKSMNAGMLRKILGPKMEKSLDEEFLNIEKSFNEERGGWPKGGSGAFDELKIQGRPQEH
jgi:hypothetical protein